MKLLTDEERQQQKKDRRKKIRDRVILIILVIIIILLLLRSCGDAEPLHFELPKFSTEVDEDANTDFSKMSTEEIQAELNRQVEESMTTISMLPYITFKKGETKAKASILNDESNKHPQVVELKNLEDDTIIYTSKAIPIGSKVDYITLDVELDKGTYKCEATFNNIDKDTGVVLGSAKHGNITVKVE